MKKKVVGAVLDELADVRLGDARLERRAREISSALAERPDSSLPRAMASGAATEGLYRFLSNESVDFEALLAPHIESTLNAATSAGDVLAVHDTTAFDASAASVEEVGYLNTGRPGFLAHVSLLVSRNRAPLGVAAVELFRRDKKPAARKQSKKRSGSETRKNSQRESLRWGRAVAAIGEMTRERCKVVHVMDREADIYDLLAAMLDDGNRFVVRLARDRRVASEEGSRELVSNSLESAEFVMKREVRLSRRAPASEPQRRRTHPPREVRMATLQIHAKPMEIMPPNYVPAAEKRQLPVNVVHVVENDAAQPHPVQWTLLTSEPIGTRADVERIVDAYRARWVIEEFFKAIKTGCAYEARKLEGERSLHNLLALTIPIAHYMLALRSLSRAATDAPAAQVVTPMQLLVLRSLQPKLPKAPTAREVLLGIAALGGHLKHNGEPGWQSLYAGAKRLFALVEGAELGMQLQKDVINR